MGKTRPGLAISVGVLGLVLGDPARADFVADSEAKVDLRNFYENYNYRNADRPSIQEWGQGAVFKFQSGFTEGPLGVGVDLLGMYGVRLDGGGRQGKAGVRRAPNDSGVFPYEHGGNADNQFAKADATAKARFSKTEMRVGAFMPKLPVVNYNDSRMLPQIFEGEQITSNEIDGLSLIAGRYEHTRTRASSDSVPLSIAGAGAQSNKFYFAGADYQLSKALLLRYYFGNLKDFYQQHFLGLQHDLALAGGNLQTDLRYFHSGSDGNNGRLRGRADGYVSGGYWRVGDGSSGEVDNDTWSAKFTYSHSGHEVSLGYQQASGKSDFAWLNQGGGATTGLITEAMVTKFTNAEERVRMAGYGYNFEQIGVPGLKASVVYWTGDHIRAPGGDNKEWERDFRIDYVIPAGAWKGLGFTYRNGVLRSNDVAYQDEHRLYLSYTIPLF